MQIAPVYDGEPILRIEGLGNPARPLRRQRERLLALLRGLDESQWDAPSRCEKWSVKDVVAHLIGVDRFWDVSFAAGARGEPTRFLTTFDPVASPEQMVDALRALSPADVLAQFETNCSGFLATADAVVDWDLVSEAPPGHLPTKVTALHALWDAWVHERDIALPLGLTPVVEHDEVTLVLQYAAALSPAISASARRGKRGALVVTATDPSLVFTVEVGDRVVVRAGEGEGGARLSGPAVDLVEALSHRAPLPHALAAQDQWLLAGLAEVFDVSAT